MNSLGHRRAILNRWHKRVNVGLSRNVYNFIAAQRFEMDYAEYDGLPAI